MLVILNDGMDRIDINHNFICLVPKVKTLESPKDLRPTSLCNVVMKTITKYSANRIKFLLGDFVDEAQSAFLLGRHITDNPLTGFEVFHYMKKRKGRTG